MKLQDECWIYLTRSHDNKPWNQCCCICENNYKPSDNITKDDSFVCTIEIDGKQIDRYNSEHGLCEMFERKVD